MAYSDPVREKEYQKAYHAEHRTERLAYLKEWRTNNPEKVLANNIEYAAAHRDALNAAKRARRKANPEKTKAKDREYHIRKKYGLTVTEYETVLARGCAICGTHERRLVMDHCHASGKTRDCLCDFCNTAIGKFQDDARLLRRAAEYVETHQFS